MLNSVANTSHWISDRPAHARLWDAFCAKVKFKFIIPHLRTVRMESIKLNVSSFSPVMKNNLLLGRYEVQERLLAKEFLTANDSVLEVGGAIGFMGLFCQICLGITRYTTIEANPNTIRLLRENYELNHRTPNVWNLALAAEDGEVTLNVGRDFWENTLVGDGDGGEAVPVQSVSLASLVRRLDYQPSTVIIDIEGAEQFVDFRQLPSSVRKVIIELHPRLVGESVTSRIVNDFIGLGFHVAREMEGTFVFLRP